MGEIGMMVSRLQQEGFDLEDMIDEELRAAGFLELCERTTRTLLQRAVAVEESHSTLRRLLDSIDTQLKEFQGTLQTPRVSSKDVGETSQTSKDQQENQQQRPVATVIVIDDDESEFVDVADMSCQASFEEIENETGHREKQQEKTLSSSSNGSSSPQQRTEPKDVLQKYVPIRPASTTVKDSVPFQTVTSSEQQQTISKHSEVAVSSVSSVAKTPPVIYRTLKSPVESGAPLLPQRVALKSSPPSLPVQQSMPSLKSSATVTATASSVMSPVDNRSSSSPSVTQPSPIQTPSPVAGPSSADRKETLEKEKSPPAGPPKFEVGTRVIGQRADELWYPGVIEKILSDKNSQKIRYKVKFDKGTRGLLSSNHISLESNPNPAVLNVGSRVVGIYGKLDVLYAGIVAENACAENKNRFLVFFDDGFAQYLPVKKLHHVYHTGKKVWDEVAEHSKEFIQEYLEEFPNRPMVKLKVHQWVKTEWRGQWLKAKVLQLDSSLVKMLFQIDNRSEWLYRGSTRLEPLYSALVDGKISTAKKKRSRKLTRGPSGKSAEPFIDYSITKPCFGVSPYSKTDPLGEQQRKLEEKRLQTQLETQRQQEQQEQLRDESKKLSTSPVSTPPATTSSDSRSTSTVTATTSTVSSASSAIRRPSTDSGLGADSRGISDSSASRSDTSGSSGKQNRGPGKESGSGAQPTSAGSFQSTSAKQHTIYTGQASSTGYQSNTACKGGHCTSVPGLVRKDSGITKHADTSMSVIQASTARKQANAGPVIPKDHFPRPNGIEVIDLDCDGTTAMLHVPTESDQIMNSLTAHKNEYLGSNMDVSFLDDLYNAWEAPWLRTNRRDVRSTGCNRVPAFQIPANNRRKQDVASLIEERLKHGEVDHRPVAQCEVPGLPVLNKTAPKGPHKCSRLCNPPLSFEEEESVKHNPRAIPLLLKWKREIAQRYPGNKKTVYYRAPCNKRLRSMKDVADYLTLTEAVNVCIDQFTFDPDISCQDTVFRDVEPICPDISRGAEAVPISVVNEVDTCFPPPIDYVSRRILAEGVNMVLDPGFLACCDCTDNCQDKTKCSCAQLTIQASAAVGGKEDPSIGYEFRRLREGVQTGIYECNRNCACASQCFNRVVQNGIQLRLQVFKTENRGWGLRSLDDIPMGTFVCTYAGQILNEDMANKEGRDFGDEYLAELDHIEVVEKAKEGYESNVSDLEEDDSVIYRTLGADSSSSGSGSGNSGESSLSEDESSEVDSLLSEESYSSGRNSRQGDSEQTNHKPARRKKRKRSGRRTEKKKRSAQGEEMLMVERESKAHCLSHLADQKWCYLALKRYHDDQKQAAAFLRKITKIEETGTSGAQTGAENDANESKEAEAKPEEKEVKDTDSVKQPVDKEEKSNSQSSDFDFDEVDETFCQKMRDNTLQNRPVNNEADAASVTRENDSTNKDTTGNAAQEGSTGIIDLTSDTEVDSEECSTFKDKDLNSASQKEDLPALIKPEKVSPEPVTPEPVQPENPDKQEKPESSAKPVEDTDSAPPLLSAEDLSKLAAKNTTVADEPPVLTKMNPTRRISNSLEDMISRLSRRVLTAHPSSSDSSLNGTDGPSQMDFENSSADVLDKISTEKSPSEENASPATEKYPGVENALGIRVEPISDPSSPETENMESFPPSPSSLRSDVSKAESIDRKSEISTGSSKRSAGVSKPPSKKFKADKAKIHYSRSHPKPSTTSPSIKASPNTPSPSRPSLSRQSSASSKRLSTRLMFGEEHCYVIDAKAYGNCGRYLNHSCSPNLFVQNVFVDTHDLRFPWVAFFTQQNVAAGTELTWDYAYEVDSVKGKVLHCYCGSAECRGRLL